MRAHIGLSERRRLHDLLVISLGKIRQSGQKYVPIAAERDIRPGGVSASEGRFFSRTEAQFRDA